MLLALTSSLAGPPPPRLTEAVRQSKYEEKATVNGCRSPVTTKVRILRTSIWHIETGSRWRQEARTENFTGRGTGHDDHTGHPRGAQARPDRTAAFSAPTAMYVS